jgi:DtxR family transcriptional regulator, Mn-dependent transcriptional regulator
MLTYVEENYLKSIYHLSNQGQAEVSTNALAEALCTRPASVTDMLKKLSTKELIHYVKYQGVSLTSEGKQQALQIVRKHRLWEVFLFQKLNFTWDEVHEVAEQLEHIQSTTLIKRLDEFLGFPEVDPHGDPIPDAQGRIKARQKYPLQEMQIDKQGVVIGVRETSALFLQFLDKVGIQIGSRIKMLDKIPFDGSVEISINEKSPVILSHDIAKNIYVSQH